MNINRFSRCVTVWLLTIGVLALVPATPASAAGTPDVSLAKDMPAEVLYGAPIPVTLTLTNPSGPDGFNVTFRDVLPPGVSYVPGSADVTPTELPQPDGSTVLIWENVADILTGSEVTLDYQIETDATFDATDTVTNDAAAYTNSDPRILPDVDPDTGVVSDFTGNDDASDSTFLAPFIITKTEPSAEQELLRGVHEHKTVYTLTIDNNLVNPTNDFVVVDFVPADVEFLGCGGVDNSTGGTEEYPGVGRIDDYADPPLAIAPCVDPSSVTTVTVDPDGPGPLPNAVYTRVEWDSAAIAAARSSDDLPAGGSFVIEYIAGIPLRENVAPGPVAPTANLDNNTGPLTTEDESGSTNYTEANGQYNGTLDHTDSDSAVVFAEDVSIHKTASTDTFEQGDPVVFTLEIESSEYATATGPITITDTIPATLDFDSAVPAPTSGPVLNADGTETYTWILPAFSAPSSTAGITINTSVRDDYRTGAGGTGIPVAANDSFANTTDLATDATIITDNDGSTEVVALVDESSVSLFSSGPTLEKEVSLPGPDPLNCLDGTGITFDPAFASSYRPGDRVCFRITVDFPPALDTLNPIMQDYLPAGFELDTAAAGGGWQFGANNTVPPADVAFTDSSPLLEWDLSDVDALGSKLEIVIQTVVNDPLAAAPGDVLENLAKFRYENASGEVFQARDGALAEWSEPIVDITKGVLDVNDVVVPGAPADGIAVQEGDVVTYRLDISNTGTEPADNISVRDVLPPGITCADVSNISNSGACDAANGWIQWESTAGLAVGVGGSTSLTYDVTVPLGVSAGASFVNESGVRSYTGDTNSGTDFTYIPGNNIDPTLTPNTDPADDPSEIVTELPTIDKSRTTSIDEAGNAAANQATIGETISYTVSLELAPGLTYYNAVVTDSLNNENDLDVGTVGATLDGAALPAGFVLSTDDAANSWTLTLPTPYAVPVGAAQVIEITFDAVVTDVASNTRGTGVPNRVDFDYQDASGNDRNVFDNLSTVVVEPNIVLEKVSNDSDGIVTSGDTIGFTLDITNDDTPGSVSVAHDTVVVDTIPADLIVLDAPGGSPVADGGVVGPDGGSWNATDRTITWTIATIDPGDTASVSYDATVVDPVVAGASIVNEALASTTSMAGDAPGERTTASPQGGPGSGYQDPADNTLTVPGLPLTKSATPGTATVGEPITYEIEFVLPAGLAVFDLTVIDQLPSGVIFESLTSVVCDEGGAACSPDLATGDATVIPAGPTAPGDDVAFFFDDQPVAGAGDRTVTITYVAVVADATDADDGATLTNGASVHWNATDTLASPPATVPPTGSFDGSSPVDDADVDTVEPSLSIDKDVVGQNGDDDTRRAVPGETLEYSITITNNGTAPAFDATVTDLATDPTWAFTDTTAIAGVTNTDADPAGGLAWTIDGPIPASGGSVTITYELVVPAGYDSANENAAGSEQTNVADIPSYFGVPEADRTANPDRDYRSYDDVVEDQVDIELDLASIGDTVWFDVDGDGIQDPGEPGIADTTVTVTYLGPDGVLGGGDDEVFVTTTDANGNYLVEDLPGGSYVVEVDVADPDFPAGLDPSYDLDGGTTNPNGVWSGALGEDEDQRDVDFGYTGTGSIGDTIYLDQDLDGAQDPGEDGIGGVTVTVTWLGPDGVAGGGDDVVYTAVTDVDGMYLVEDLPAGEYTVEVDTSTLPADYVNVADPDTPGAPDDQSVLTLGAGEANLDQDFGYAGNGSIGDTIYLDQDGNGTQNGAEPGLEGVIVELVHFGPDGVPGGDDDSFFSTSTDANGNYLFENLPHGNYEVTVTGGITLIDNTGDPDTAGIGDSTSQTTLTATNPNDLDQDFGYFADSVLGDKVWYDTNGDGIQDPGEPGLAGVEVTIDGPLGLMFTTTTDANGDYIFENIPDGDYTVTINPATLPGGLTQTFDDDGIGTPDTSDTTLVDSDLMQDFGYVGSGQIGDTIWLDTDGDGVIDGTESGIGGVTVTLEWAQPSGPPIVFTTTTDANGNYLFDNLPNGDFTVTVDTSTLPAGLTATFDDDGGLDSTSAVTLTDGDNVDLDQDFGYRGTGSIGDTIWFDRDGDGVIDPDETPLPGIDVTLTWVGPSGPVTSTVTTDANGQYLFEGLPPGDFTVAVDASDLPAGMSETFDADGGFDSTSAVALADGEANLDQDFGYRGTGSIGDTIWYDLDGDGVVDPGEPGIPGQTVELVWDSPTGPVTYTTTTDADGQYLFEGLPPGDYTITVVGGIADVAANTGDPGADGDSTNTITLADGETNLDQDFGYQGINSIGDTVWFDVDGDGTDDGAAAEPRLPGAEVTITWFGPDGVPGGGDDVVFPPLATDADGEYLAPDLPDGTFGVEITGGLPTGIDTFTFDDDGGLDGISVVTDLGVGDAGPVADLDQDFGVTGSSSVGDTIWLDVDADGTQDPNEPGVSGVTVTVTSGGGDGIIGSADDIVVTTTTDADGTYFVGNLPPGPVEVSYAPTDLPAGYAPNSDLDGGDLDMASTDLAVGESELDVDFGVVGDSSLDGTVWIDLDNDGVQDPGEAGIPGVDVIVTWNGPIGPVEIVVTTDADGNWELPTLPSGDYTTAVDLDTLPDGLVPTTPVDGAATLPVGGTGSVDNGFVPAGSIGDTVFEDTNGDGLPSADEPGVTGVVVILLDDEGNEIDRTTTDEDGTYTFDGLPPGDYTVTIDIATLPDDRTVVVDTADGAGGGAPDGQTTVTIGAGEDRTDVDFGIDPPAPIPLTGSDTMQLLLVAVMLAGAGGALLIGRRRFMSSAGS